MTASSGLAPVQQRVVRVEATFSGQSDLGDEAIDIRPCLTRIFVGCGKPFDLDEATQPFDLVQAKRPVPEVPEAALLDNPDRRFEAHQKNRLVHGAAVRDQALMLNASANVRQRALDREQCTSPTVRNLANVTPIRGWL